MKVVLQEAKQAFAKWYAEKNSLEVVQVDTLNRCVFVIWFTKAPDEAHLAVLLQSMFQCLAKVSLGST